MNASCIICCIITNTANEWMRSKMNRRVGVFTNAWPNFQSKAVEPLGLYWKKMEVIYKLLRLMGYLPYQLNKAHKIIKISFQSKLWAIIACIILVTSVLIEDKQRLTTANYWNSYEQVLESLVRLMFTNTVIFYVSTWWDLPKLITYTNDWSKLSSNLTKMPNTKLNSYWILKTCLLILAILIMSAVVVDQIIFLGYIDPLRLFSYFVTVYFSIVLTTFWIANCNFIMQMARTLRKSLITNIQKKPSTELVRHYCILWLQLHQKTEELTEAIKVSLVLHLIINNIELIFISYIWMSALIYKPELKGFVGYLSALLISTITLITICESSNSVTNELGYKYTTELLSLKSLQPHVVQEVELFLKTIEAKSTDIVLGGCVTLNRKLIVTIISTTITYIIVLVQFDIRRQI